MQESWKRFRDEEVGCCCVVQRDTHFYFRRVCSFQSTDCHWIELFGSSCLCVLSELI